MSAAGWVDAVQFDERGLVPAIAQDVHTGQVLMMAWMNRESLLETLKVGFAVYWSRSRSRQWRKGETSGHVQKIHEIRLDCDADCLLLKVEQVGGIACHTGRAHCFFNQLLVAAPDGLPADARWVEADPVLKDPATIYGVGH